MAEAGPTKEALEKAASSAGPVAAVVKPVSVGGKWLRNAKDEVQKALAEALVGRLNVSPKEVEEEAEKRQKLNDGEKNSSPRSVGVEQKKWMYEVLQHVNSQTSEALVTALGAKVEETQQKVEEVESKTVEHDKEFARQKEMMVATNQQIQEVHRKLEEKGGGWKEPPLSERPEAIVTGFPRDTPAKEMTDEITKTLTELGVHDKLTSCVANRDPGSSVFHALQDGARQDRS